MKMTNWHTHTMRCGHASNTDEEYIQAALDAGYELFGFSDHTAWPYKNGFRSIRRMPEEQLDEYVTSIRALQRKYAGQIEIRLGLECEYFPAYLGWLKKTAAEKNLDYLLLGNHDDLTDDGGFYFGESSTPEHIRLYTRRTLEGMETGLFSCLAHPDLVMRGYAAFDDACEEMAYTICTAAKRLDMILEYNLMGNDHKKRTDLPWKGVGYPHERFWQIVAEVGCKGIIGLDSHDAGHVSRGEEYRDAVRYLDRLGVERVTEIPMKKYLSAQDF